MASQTSNLHLTLPTGTENVSRQIINTNMSTIDSAVGAVPSGQNLQSQVTNLANESSSLKSALNYNPGQNLIGEEVNKLYRVPVLKNGDKLTITRSNGAAFSETSRLYIYDVDGNSLDYYSLLSGNTERVATLNNLNKDVYFISFNSTTDGPFMVNYGSTAFPYRKYNKNIASLDKEMQDKYSEYSDLKKQIEHNAIPTNLVGIKPNILYRCYVPAGSSITMSTSDGSAIDANVKFSFYDKNKTYIDYCSFPSGNTVQTYNWAVAKGEFYYVSHNYTGSKLLQAEIGKVATSYQEHYPNVGGINDLIKQNTIEIYTQGGHDIIINPGTDYSISVTIPENYFVSGYDTTQTFIQTGSQQTFNVPHNNFLIYHNASQTFQVVTQEQIKNLMNITVLLFNNSGIVRGQWEKYQKIEETLIKQNTIEIYTQPERPIRIKNNSTDVIVTIPDKYFITGYESSQVFIQSGSSLTFTIPHNSFLIFHNDTGIFEVVTQTMLRNGIYNITILGFNSGGILRGQWSKYQYDACDYYSDPTSIVKGINHQGFNSIAPANNLLAYIESKKQGFTYVEADVQFTSDGVPVLLHDATINSVARNADGTEITGDVYIADITYEEALSYDFGIIKGEEFAGVKISRFDDFIKLCKFLSLRPYIDSSLDSSKISVLFGIIDDYDMRDNVTFISGNQATLNAVKAIDGAVRVGYYPGTVDSNVVEYILTFENAFIDLQHSNVTTEIINLLKLNKIPLEVWTVDNASTMKTLSPYISGVTSNTYNYDRVMKQSYLQSKPIYVV